MRRAQDRFTSTPGSVSLSLDHGLDEQECPSESVEVGEHGMYFQSRWRFADCTEMQVTFTVTAGKQKRRRYLASAMVAGCEKVGHGCFRTALHFIEPVRELAGGRDRRVLAVG